MSFKKLKKLSSVPGSGLSDIYVVLHEQSSVEDLLNLEAFPGIEVDR